MGKRADQAKKRKKLNNAKPQPIHHVKSLVIKEDDPTLPPTPPDELITPEEIDTAIYVLQTLGANADLLAGREMRALKTEVYGLHRVLVEGAAVGASLTSKISAALRDYRFTDALIHLFEMYTRRLPPKLGALQRWVRECDATSNADGSPGDPEAMRCLDLILRIANMPAVASTGAGEVSGAGAGVGTGSLGGGMPNMLGESLDARDHVRNPRIWRAREPGAVEGEIKIWDLVQNGTLFGAESESSESSQLNSGSYPGFRQCHKVLAADRRPPNLYDSTVYTSEPGAIRLTPPEARRQPSKLDVPGVPGAFIVLDVFTPDECLQIVRAANAVGWEKDQAADGSALQKTSILAHNFVWLADQQFHDHFYSQIEPFVRQNAPVGADGVGGGRVRAINKRFRVYQYKENQLYRPHIDGAWPAAGLHPETGEYLHDSQPATDPLWSRYTLLVYLNSDIPEETGCTTFFLPSEQMGVMDATSVRPVQGAVLCFPHGDTQGSLLHEGSAVGADGGKLVIRTDLLYEAKGFGQFKPDKALVSGD